MGKWLWGIIILAIISFFVSLFLHGGTGVSSASMGDSIRDALKSEHSWAKVNMDGDVAKITGEAPNQSAIDNALALAKKTINTPVKGSKDRTCGLCDKHKASFSATSNATIKTAVVAPAKPACLLYTSDAADD